MERNKWRDTTRHEVHHKIPRYAGGQDVLENLELLTPAQHKERHMELYKEHGNFRDLCAYHMIGYNFTEAHKVSSSNGGKAGGAACYAAGVGIFRSEEERKEWASAAGKIGGKRQKELGIGIHSGSPEEKKARMLAARKIQDDKKTNKFVHASKELQAERGKKGGPKNKGFKWYTNGADNFKYTPKQQLVLSFDIFLQQNTEYRKGRK